MTINWCLCMEEGLFSNFFLKVQNLKVQKTFLTISLSEVTHGQPHSEKSETFQE